MVNSLSGFDLYQRSYQQFALRCIDRVPIRCVARSEWASRQSIWRKPAPARPPEPTSTALAEGFQRPVGVEHFDAGPRPRVEEERLMASALAGVGCGGARHHHAALSAGSARANPRRYSAALD